MNWTSQWAHATLHSVGLHDSLAAGPYLCRKKGTTPRRQGLREKPSPYALITTLFRKHNTCDAQHRIEKDEFIANRRSTRPKKNA
jgi:hypothetical protein